MYGIICWVWTKLIWQDKIDMTPLMVKAAETKKFIKKIDRKNLETTQFSFIKGLFLDPKLICSSLLCFIKISNI